MIVNFLKFISQTLSYKLALVFFAVYPITTSIAWVVTTAIYYYRREHQPDEKFYDIEKTPSSRCFNR